MTEAFCKTGLYETDHSKFGGLIFPSDFNTNVRGKNNYSGSPIARRIENDDRFDRQCIRNKESKE